MTAFFTLVDNDLVSLDTFIIYSKPVMAATRENNFKNPRRNTRDKTEKAKGNPQATLGYYSYQSADGKNETNSFSGGSFTLVGATRMSLIAGFVEYILLAIQ
ncbi:hypothetical protein HQ563_06380 [bacterium]|nr:hypothetical protein [bacterium]